MEQVQPSKRPIIVIALVTAVSMLGNEMLVIVMPLYWRFFGLQSIWQVGILLSANRLIRIPMNSLVGWCYKKVGKRTGILFAVLAAVSSTFFYGTLKGFWFLLFARCLWGIAWSFLRLGGYLTVITCSNPSTRGESVGLYNGLWGLGSLFGMLFGGFLAELVGIRTVTMAFSFIGACSIPFVLKYIPNSINISDSGSTKVKGGSSIWKDKSILSSYATGLTTAFIVYGVFSSTLSMLVEFQMDQRLLVFGMVVGAGTISGFILAMRNAWEPFVSPYLGRCSDGRFGRIPLLIIALISAMICMSIFPLKISLYLFISILVIFQLTATLLITMSDSIATDVATGSSEVAVIAYYTVFVDLGSALGPLLGYMVIDAFGLKWLFWLSALAIIPILSYWAYKALASKPN